MVSELLDESFGIQKTRENMEEEVESLVSNIMISIARNVKR